MILHHRGHSLENGLSVGQVYGPERCLCHGTVMAQYHDMTLSWQCRTRRAAGARRVASAQAGGGFSFVYHIINKTLARACLHDRIMFTLRLCAEPSSLKDGPMDT